MSVSTETWHAMLCGALMAEYAVQVADAGAWALCVWVGTTTPVWHEDDRVDGSLQWVMRDREGCTVSLWVPRGSGCLDVVEAAAHVRRMMLPNGRQRTLDVGPPGGAVTRHLEDLRRRLRDAKPGHPAVLEEQEAVALNALLGALLSPHQEALDRFDAAARARAAEVDCTVRAR